jgi:hypothetical membrane protein
MGPDVCRAAKTTALAAGGVVGPAAFIADWTVLGARRSGYSPVDDAISRLAELGSSTRPAMTAGFLAYGVGLVSYGLALRAAERGPTWAFAVGSGAASFGVATFPLGTPTSGRIHAVFALVGYGCLAAIPMVTAATTQRRRLGRRRPLEWASIVTGVTCAGLLVISVVEERAHGATQRAGLTVGDLWIVCSAIGLIRSLATHRTEARPPA